MGSALTHLRSYLNRNPRYFLLFTLTRPVGGTYAAPYLVGLAKVSFRTQWPIFFRRVWE
jgi:hypothetical protein